MKNEIIIKPLTGIEWVQGNINLEEQRQSLNLPQVQAEKIRQSLYLGNGDIRVDFDDKDTVEGNADVEIEKKMAMYFEAVAIGRKGYYTL